jgi:phenylacetate-CoA ligase
MTAEALYPRLPVPLQQAACSLEGWRIRRERFGSRFLALLGEAEERAGWPEDRLIEYRDQRYAAFQAHALKSTPHYRNHAGGFGVLEKETVRENVLDFRADKLRAGTWKAVHTSGTTGSGLRFWATPEALQEQWAIWWRYRRWHGLQPGTLCGYFGGRPVAPPSQTKPPYWRYDLAGRQIFFSGYHMREECFPAYIGELRRARPPWLHGYPSLLALLASYVLDRGLDLGYRIQWITTGAENLLPHQKAQLERAFGVRPRQHYGMAEAVANASECEAGRLHVDEDFAFVELVPEAGGACRIVGTNFTNPATPLIRYAVADHARWSAERCSCGRPGRILESIDGRQEDYVILGDGTRLGRLDHIFKDLTAIGEAQILQERPGHIRVRVIRGRRYQAADEERLKREIATRMAGIGFEIEYPATLERTAAGKLRLVINRIPAAQLKA